MISETLLSDCREMALAVAPELQERPLYVVDHSVFAGLPIGQGCLGYAMTGPTVLEMRNRLQDQWQGHGQIIALDSQAIRESRVDGDFTESVLTVMVHEIGHAVPVDPAENRRNDRLADIADFSAGMEFQLQQLADSQDFTLAQGQIDPDHNDRFIRRVCHIYSRAVLLGYQVSLDNLFGGSCWFCGQAAHWVASLLPELYTMRLASFADIEATKPPVTFTRLWSNSVEFYRTFHNPNEAGTE